ncbi:MAG: aspartate aminotransferase family protein [Rhodothermales bacterium]
MDADLHTEGDLNVTSQRAAWQARQTNAATREVLDRDSAVFVHQSLSTPCLDVLTRAEGPYIQTQSGQRLLDFHGNWVHQVGFGHPKVIAAITEQMRTLPFCTRRYTNMPAVALAERLTSLAPGNLNRVLFAPGGALAMGMALKVARMATGRFKTISMWDAFHGASLDAISVGGEALFRQGIGPLLPGTEHAPPPNPQGCPWHCGTTCSLRCAEYIEYMLAKEGDVAAVVAETVRSTPSFPPLNYWKQVRAACDRHGALLILDEIPHAFGRTGRMFTCEHYDITPDILVVGKGLGGGIFPLAAMLCRDDLDLPAHTALGHYTHEKNPLACAAALAMLDVIEEEGLLERTRHLGRIALNRLHQLESKHDGVKAVRGLGLMLGIDLAHPTGTDEATRAWAERVMYHTLDHGLSFKVTQGRTLLLVPALTIAEDELLHALELIDAALSATL